MKEKNTIFRTVELPHVPIVVRGWGFTNTRIKRDVVHSALKYEGLYWSWVKGLLRDDEQLSLRWFQ